jgi:hypothetical protein
VQNQAGNDRDCDQIKVSMMLPVDPVSRAAVALTAARFS